MTAKIILLIENEREINNTLRELLELENYTVLSAENGLAALEVLKTSPMPNLILLDMKMPVMDGWQFAAAFHAKYGNQTPIIAITAGADAEQRAKDIDAVSWESKPFEMDSLLDKIKVYAS